MLKSGDFDPACRRSLRITTAALPGAEAHPPLLGTGGCSFTEQLENFGLPLGWSWGWPETPDPITGGRRTST